MHKYAEAFAIALMFALVSLWSVAFQPQNNINGYDGMFYLRMSEHIAHAQPITGPLPWIYRVGTPFLAAAFAPLTGDLLASFKFVNIAASALTTFLLVLYVRQHVASCAARLVVMFLFLTQWHAPVRYAYFYPTSVDFWLMVFVLCALLLCDAIREILKHSGTENVGAWRPKPLLQRYGLIGLLSLVVFVGTLFREVIALFGVLALLIANPIVVARNPTYVQRVRPSHPMLLLPLAAALAGVLLLRALVIVNQEGYPYTFDGTVYLWLYDKRLLPYLYAWFVAFGPALALALYDWRRGAVWLAKRQEVALFVLALVALAWVGGTDTERFLYWGMPIFYVLLGRALDEHQTWLRRSPLLIIVLVITQLLSQRFLLPTPDFNTIAQPQLFPLLTVLGADTAFEHLHTFYSTLNWQSLSFQLTMQHLGLAALLLLWISRRAGTYTAQSYDSDASCSHHGRE
jgi:hypothetical protein